MLQHTPSPLVLVTTMLVLMWAATLLWLWVLSQRLHRARRDPVTGLLTRATWQTHARKALSKRSTIGLLDVDKFKAINDHYGHQAGDAVLHTIATRLTSTVDSSVVVGRLGGDEFALLAPFGLTTEQLDHLTTALTSLVPIPSLGDLPVSVSVGIADVGSLPSARTALSLSEGLAAADLGMYHAKTHHHRWHRYTPAPEEVLPIGNSACRRGSRVHDRAPARRHASD